MLHAIERYDLPSKVRKNFEVPSQGVQMGYCLKFFKTYLPIAHHTSSRNYKVTKNLEPECQTFWEWPMLMYTDKKIDYS